MRSECIDLQSGVLVDNLGTLMVAGLETWGVIRDPSRPPSVQ